MKVELIESEEEPKVFTPFKIGILFETQEEVDNIKEMSGSNLTVADQIIAIKKNLDRDIIAEFFGMIYAKVDRKRE